MLGCFMAMCKQESSSFFKALLQEVRFLLPRTDSKKENGRVPRDL